MLAFQYVPDVTPGFVRFTALGTVVGRQVNGSPVNGIHVELGSIIFAGSVGNRIFPHSIFGFHSSRSFLAAAASVFVRRLDGQCAIVICSGGVGGGRSAGDGGASRFAIVIIKATGIPLPTYLPRYAVGVVQSGRDCRALLRRYMRQGYRPCVIRVGYPDGDVPTPYQPIFIPGAHRDFVYVVSRRPADICRSLDVGRAPELECRGRCHSNRWRRRCGVCVTYWCSRVRVSDRRISELEPAGVQAGQLPLDLCLIGARLCVAVQEVVVGAVQAVVQVVVGCPVQSIISFIVVKVSIQKQIDRILEVRQRGRTR